MVNIKQEFIICSAIWIKDFKSYDDNPINISTGLVVSGRRHNNCFATFKLINPDFNFTKDNIVCGFITNTNKFLNREEAFVVAQNNNQLLIPDLHKKAFEINLGIELPKDSKPILTSEDLFIFDENEKI